MTILVLVLVALLALWTVLIYVATVRISRAMREPRIHTIDVNWFIPWRVKKTYYGEA